MGTYEFEEPEDYTLGEYVAGVSDWVRECFQGLLSSRKARPENSRRFLEESLELCQSLDMSKEDALQLVEYVFNRPVGDPPQEVGGVMVCLAIITDGEDISLDQAAWNELRRVSRPEIMEKIRNKQVSKQLHGIGGTVLPGYEKGSQDEVL